LLLDSGATYTLGFDAKASSAWILGAAVGEDGGSYRKIVSLSDTLGTAMANFSVTFLDTLPSSVGLRLEFELGPKTGDVYLDNIKLAMTGAATSLRRQAGLRSGAIFRTSEGISWSLSRAPEQDVELRLVGLDGRQVAEISIPAGIQEGRFPADLPRTVLVARLLSGGKVLGKQVLAP
jgi:hypothetical protein